MGSFFLKLFDYLREHRLFGLSLFLILTALLLLSVSRVRFSEDISEFLPLDENGAKSMSLYQEISGASRIIAIVQAKDGLQMDADDAVSLIDTFCETIEEEDSTGLVRNLMGQVDMDSIFDVVDFVYDNAPYFLQEEDYARMENSLDSPGFFKEQLEKDKRTLMFPTGNMVTRTIGKDPLALFQPLTEGLQTGAVGMNFEMYDGYIFSRDMSRAVVTMESPFGSSETEMNSRLAALLEDCAGKALDGYDGLEIHLIGGPVIAVGNSSRIKADSVLSVLLALLLIVPLLYISFKSIRNISLIVLSIAWGWLVALGVLVIFHSTISAIVVGISSAIIGIAANYPLHLVSHLSHNPDRRSSLKEIVAPLVTGNITTVGAFLTLVPLDSVALRDLGLFSSFLLAGTIFFVLVFLPHLAMPVPDADSRLISFLGSLKPENSKAAIIAVLALTLVLGFFSTSTSFDSDMSHINYMTDSQREDMAYFQNSISLEGSLPKVYVVSSAPDLDSALSMGQEAALAVKALEEEGLVESGSDLCKYISSMEEQERRIGRWNSFVSERKEMIEAGIASAAAETGFKEGAFAEFYGILSKDYAAMDPSYFDVLASTVFSSNIVADRKGEYSVVDVLSVEESRMDEVKERLSEDGIFNFDVAGMNSSVANNLSDDFNYIGWACSFIVFFFLWLSFGSFELALLSFIPMAVSWIWILGIMSLLGIKFNIVNIILATFIFGQGDDYTIFMTEGACYEYTYRRKILDSYKNSIVISALIMFVGIGSLIVAKHPAMHSLGEVTIIGMLSVVLMAYLFPPLLYGFLVRKNGVLRLRPVSVVPVLRRSWYWLLSKVFRLGPGQLVRLIPGIRVTMLPDSIPSGGIPVIYCRSALERAAALSVCPSATITEDISAATHRLFGAEMLCPEDVFMMFRGTMSVAPCDCSMDKIDFGAYYKDLVIDRYRYKEAEIFKSVKANLKQDGPLDLKVENGTAYIRNKDHGERALLYALAHKDCQVVVLESSEEKAEILKYCMEGLDVKLRIESQLL